MYTPPHLLFQLGQLVVLLRHTQLTNDAYSLSLPATTIYNDRIQILTKKLFGSSFVVGFDSNSNSDSDNDNDNNASYKDWITNDSTWRNLGDTCTISGFTLFASRMYGRAASLEPGRWSNWVGLGKSLRKLGRDGPALAAIKRARELSEGTIAVRQVEALVKLWGEEGMEKIFQEEMESPIEVVVEEYVFGGRILRGVRDGRG